MPRVKINLPSPGCALSILCRVVKLPNTQSKRGPTREGVKAGCVCVEGPATLSMISTAAGKSVGREDDKAVNNYLYTSVSATGFAERN